MRRYVVGTAGHVDHGKTSLVRALTGVDTDRLPEEKARGISIELGFAPLVLDDLSVSLVDVPGHRRLVRTMIAGAAGIELVLLVVAADEGVMPQTREHVAVCELLGLDRAIVVVNKVDAVSPDLAAMAAEEARALLGARWKVDLVQCSAKTGEGIPELRTTLAGALRALPRRELGGGARLGVDRVFTVRGAGTVVTGTLVSGSLRPGDPLVVVGAGTRLEAAARAVHVHDRAVPIAEAPTRVAVNLAGVALDAVARGDVVTSEVRLASSGAVDLLVRAPHALRRAAAVTAHVGTASCEARVDALTVLGDVALARVRMARPIPVAGGDRMVLRGGAGGSSGAVVGGGRVVDARPARRTSGARRRALAAGLATLEAGPTLMALVSTCAPHPVSMEDLELRFAVSSADLRGAALAAVRAGVLAAIGDGAWISRAELDASVLRARTLVREHHARRPLERGIPIETLRARLGTAGGRLVAEEAIRLAATTGPESERAVVDGDVVRSALREAPEARTNEHVERVLAALGAAGRAGTTEVTLGSKAGVAPASLRPLLQKLAREGAAVRLGDLWFAAGTVAGARECLEVHFASSRTLSVVEFKEKSGLARRQAVLMLEHFDHLGLTRREGDARVRR